MIINVTNLELGVKILTKVLPPIAFSTSAAKDEISLTESLHTARKTRGSKSKIALLFYSFLFDRGDLISYIHNVFQYNTASLFDSDGTTDSSSYIENAFFWDNSPEGDEYWNDCDNEWHLVLDQTI